MCKHPGIRVEPVGDPFILVGMTVGVLKSAGFEDDAEEVRREAMKSDRKHLMKTIREFVRVGNGKD